MSDFETLSDCKDRQDQYVTAEGVKARVLGNSVLVRVLPQETQTKGGILIPDNAIGTVYARGVVVAVGFITGAKAKPHTPIPGLKKGDHVVFVRFHEKTGSNERIKASLEEDLIQLRPADILAVCDEGDSVG